MAVPLIRPFRTDHEVLCDRLRRHDAGLTRVSPENLTDGSAVELGDALLTTNCRVRKLTVPLVRLSVTGAYESLLQYLSRNKALSHVALDGEGASEMVAARFLAACSINSAITRVDVLHGFLSTTSLGRLLRNSPSLTHLELFRCRLSPTEELKADFAENTTVEVLELDSYSQEDSAVVPILEGLENHATLQQLILSSKHSQMTSLAFGKALRHLLETTAQLQHIELLSFSLSGGAFVEIARGLQNSLSVVKLSMGSCSFDEESTEIFQSAFDRSSINSLALRGANKFAKPTGDVLACSIAGWSSLKNISVKTNSLDRDDLATFLRALCQSGRAVEQLTLHPTSGDADARACAALTEALPELRVRCLTVHLPFLTGQVKHDFVRACSSNGFLLSSDVQSSMFDWNAQDQQVVTDTCRRNVCLHECMARSEEVPVGLWPSKFIRMQSSTHGAELIFHTLLKLGDAVGKEKEDAALRVLASEGAA